MNVVVVDRDESRHYFDNPLFPDCGVAMIAIEETLQESSLDSGVSRKKLDEIRGTVIAATGSKLSQHRARLVADARGV